MTRPTRNDRPKRPATETAGTPADDHGPTFDPAAPPVQPTSEAIAAIEALGVACEPSELDAMARYLGYLRDANTRFNMTAIVDAPSMWIRHIVDSLSLLPVIASADLDAVNTDSARGASEPRPAGGRVRICDVGSGGGLPGIPLAIALPDMEVVLLEATGKKVRFLREVAAALGLANVAVVQARAEDAGQDRTHHRERYDLVVSRAVGHLAMLVELTVPLARVGGYVLAVKGERADQEIAEGKAALHALHAHVLEPIRTATGTIVPIQKMRTSPRTYPRRAGEPKRDPIGGASFRSRAE
jgi:16S rRNA (guanine527-N7)-methyltransferase